MWIKRNTESCKIRVRKNIPVKYQVKKGKNNIKKNINQSKSFYTDEEYE